MSCPCQLLDENTPIEEQTDLPVHEAQARSREHLDFALAHGCVPTPDRPGSVWGGFGASYTDLSLAAHDGECNSQGIVLRAPGAQTEDGA